MVRVSKNIRTNSYTDSHPLHTYTREWGMRDTTTPSLSRDSLAN
jgi:hypothetical protein